MQSFYSKHLHIPPPSRTLANKTMTFRHAWGTPYMQQGLLVIQCQPPPCPSVFHAVPGIYNIEFDDSESAMLLFYGFSFSLEVAYPPLPPSSSSSSSAAGLRWDGMGYIKSKVNGGALLLLLERLACLPSKKIWAGACASHLVFGNAQELSSAKV